LISLLYSQNYVSAAAANVDLLKPRLARD